MLAVTALRVTLMSLLRTLSHTRRRLAPACWPARHYADAAPAKKGRKFAPVPTGPSIAMLPATPVGDAKSSCVEGTPLVGLTWLKGQEPVVAQHDDAYPAWLWTVLEPKKLPEDQEEQRRMRKENRHRIREQNFMLTQ